MGVDDTGTKPVAVRIEVPIRFTVAPTETQCRNVSEVEKLWLLLPEPAMLLNVDFDSRCVEAPIGVGIDLAPDAGRISVSRTSCSR